jgi:hypothetical protein
MRTIASIATEEHHDAADKTARYHCAEGGIERAVSRVIAAA